MPVVGVGSLLRVAGRPVWPEVFALATHVGANEVAQVPGGRTLLSAGRFAKPLRKVGIDFCLQPDSARLGCTRHGVTPSIGWNVRRALRRARNDERPMRRARGVEMYC